MMSTEPAMPHVLPPETAAPSAATAPTSMGAALAADLRDARSLEEIARNVRRFVALSLGADDGGQRLTPGDCVAWLTTAAHALPPRYEPLAVLLLGCAAEVAEEEGAADHARAIRAELATYDVGQPRQLERVTEPLAGLLHRAVAACVGGVLGASCVLRARARA